LHHTAIASSKRAVRGVVLGLVGWLACQPSSSLDRGKVDGGGGRGGANADATEDMPGAGDVNPGTGGTNVGTGGAGTGGSEPGTGGTNTGTGGSMTGTGGAGTGGSEPGTGGVNTGAGGAGTGGSGAGGATMDTAPEVPPPARTALLVVGDNRALTAGDTKIKGLLEGRSFTVTLADDEGSNSGAAGKTLVVITSTVASKEVLAKYKDVTAPVLCLESAIYDDMKMTLDGQLTNFGEEPANEITMVAGMRTHPLAANLTGVITVSASGPNDCCGTNWGKPAASAVAIASFGPTVNANKVAIFGYARGARMMDDFLAPARRVGLFAADTTAQYLTANGIALVDAAIEWAIATE
jgi:hypothetical protein